jgi:hypothetical protein
MYAAVVLIGFFFLVFFSLSPSLTPTFSIHLDHAVCKRYYRRPPSASILDPERYNIGTMSLEAV